MEYKNLGQYGNIGRPYCVEIDLSPPFPVSTPITVSYPNIPNLKYVEIITNRQ